MHQDKVTITMHSKNRGSIIIMHEQVVIIILVEKVCSGEMFQSYLPLAPASIESFEIFARARVRSHHM